MTLFEKIKGMTKDELADYIVHTVVIAIGPENFNSEIYQSMLEAARATMDEQVEEDDVANAIGEELKENDEAGAEEVSKVIDVPEGTWTPGGGAVDDSEPVEIKPWKKGEQEENVETELTISGVVENDATNNATKATDDGEQYFEVLAFNPALLIKEENSEEKVKDLAAPQREENSEKV